MYGIRLIFGWGTIVATKDKTPNGEKLIFNTMQDANNWAQNEIISGAKFIYEPFEIKDKLFHGDNTNE